MAFDRGTDDVGNILALEHVNVRVPDQQLATLFYVVGLGLTRDPYLMVGTDNMWVNVGQQQFHLPTGRPQVLPGHVDLVVPDVGAVAARLEAVSARLGGTRFGYRTEDQRLVATCPWGNEIHCDAPRPEFGATTLGMARVAFPVRPGTAARIASFYAKVLGARATTTGSPAVANVVVGAGQTLVFRETERPLPAWDGHHIAIYIADFSAPWRWLDERKLVTEESNEHQYRFAEVVDPATGESLLTLEHEVRSARHPMFMRPLVNRNPAQRQATYVRGADAI
jgi:catechol 2,3-dioxygenase-like lactoylglutathione lyase family enzyme